MRRFWLMLLGMLLWTTSCLAGNVGVVVLHGRWGDPHGWISNLTQQIASAGYPVEAPLMNWSLAKSYQGGLDESDREVSQAIEALRQRGASRIVLIGHSIGGSFALRYARTHALAGVIVIVPAPYLDLPGFHQKVQSDLDRAASMKAGGQGDDKAWFTDWNTNQTHKSLSMTANTFLSLYDPQGPMNIDQNASALPAGLPVLWISATDESEKNREGNASAFARVPDASHARFIEVDADHLHAPDASVVPVLAWLRQLD